MIPIDRQLLLLANQAAGGSRALFEACLLLCGELPLALCVGILLALWWHDPEAPASLSRPVLADAPAPRREGLQVSRRRCVALACAVAAAFIATRLVAFAVDMPRPLAREILTVPIEADRWRNLVSGMTGFGAFPSDHAALFFALGAGLFAWRRALGIAGLAVAGLLCLCRVAVGFHYPSDMLAGGAMGAALALGSLRLAAGRGRSAADRVIAWFDRRPALAYPLLFVLALDFTRHFRLVMGGIFKLLFTVAGLLGGS